MLWSLVILVVTLPDSAFTPPEQSPSACLSEPLTLTLGDMLRMGEIGQRVLKPRCGRPFPANMTSTATPYGTTLGKVTLGSFILADHTIDVGFDLQMTPGLWFGGYPRGLMRGNSDELRFSPVVRLPREWQDKVDLVREPLLVLSGAAILSSVIVGLVRHP